jgi:hypothetical protein
LERVWWLNQWPWHPKRRRDVLCKLMGRTAFIAETENAVGVSWAAIAREYAYGQLRYC